jgi:2-polyprenyl-6-methoxyphenol hydroxylase-like FAD-dependent oxidoreductase
MEPALSAIAKHAVIIGAGMGGLAAAGAAAPWFEKVTVLERDALPDEPAQRFGALQGRHVHALLAGGQLALETLFAGFGREIVAAGAVPVRANMDVRFEAPGYDPFPQRDFGWTTVCMSRPLIEFTVRRLAQLQNVDIRSRARVRQLELDPTSAVIAAVQVEDDDGKIERLAADLVIDASGRAGPTLRLLSDLGRPAPEETVIGVDFTYATAVFEMPNDAPDGWKVVMTQPRVPESARGALLATLEHGHWILSVGGRAADEPPDEPEGFMACIKGLRTSTIYDAVKGARLIGDIARYGFRESTWRHFDRLDGMPDGLIPFGDSICRFNPVYGQGMSVAAFEGVLLGRLLAERAQAPNPLEGLSAAFLTEVQSVIKAPWDMSAIPDFIFPSTRGERPANLDQIFAYGAAFGRLAADDAEAHKLDAEVRALLKPPSALAEPGIVAKVMAVMAQMQAAA